MDSSDPNLDLDSNGVCWQCRNFEKNVSPRLNAWSESDSKLFFDRIKEQNKSKPYDCLIGLSGGLDSSFLAYRAVKKYGLRAKVFHVDAGWNTPQATKNIHRLVEHLDLNLDFETKVVNWEAMRTLQLAFFRSGVAHIDVPQDHAFLASVYNKASNLGINTILNGGNYATEGIRNPLSWLYYGSDTRQLRDISKRFGGRLNNYPQANVIRHRVIYKFFKGIKSVKPLNWLHFQKGEAEKELMDAYGYEPYTQKHFESYFTKFFEGYWLPKRFGYDTRKPQLSSLIWSGEIDRYSALEQLKQTALSELDASLLFSYVSDKLHISEDELRSFLILDKKTHNDYKNMASIYKSGGNFLSWLGLEKTIKR